MQDSRCKILLPSESASASDRGRRSHTTVGGMRPCGYAAVRLYGSPAHPERGRHRHRPAPFRRWSLVAGPSTHPDAEASRSVESRGLQGALSPTRSPRVPPVTMLEPRRTAPLWRRWTQHCERRHARRRRSHRSANRSGRVTPEPVQRHRRCRRMNPASDCADPAKRIAPKGAAPTSHPPSLATRPHKRVAVGRPPPSSSPTATATFRFLGRVHPSRCRVSPSRGAIDLVIMATMTRANTRREGRRLAREAHTGVGSGTSPVPTSRRPAAGGRGAEQRPSTNARVRTGSLRRTVLAASAASIGTFHRLVGFRTCGRWSWRDLARRGCAPTLPNPRGFVGPGRRAPARGRS
jgi:hypothetical protein